MRKLIFFFQQDNAVVHKSNATTAWLKQQKINVLGWPVYYPDMNPIENLWGIIVRSVYAGNRQHHSVSELQVALIQTWEEMQEEAQE